MSRKQTPQEAETAAIVLAVSWGEIKYKNLDITDSTRATRRAICGLIPTEARSILPATPIANNCMKPSPEGLK